MEITSILLGIALAIGVLPFIVEPFVRRRKEVGRLGLATATGGASPARAKEAALVAVRDLDFDFHTGKITETDYQPLRQQLLQAAAEAEAALQARRARAGVRRPGPNRVEADIESAVQSVRRGGQAASRAPRASVSVAGGASACVACGTPATAADKFCGRCGAALGEVCPRCAAAVLPSDRFCAACGTALDKKVNA